MEFKEKWAAHSKETMKRLCIELEKLESDLGAVTERLVDDVVLLLHARYNSDYMSASMKRYDPRTSFCGLTTYLLSNRNKLFRRC